MGTEKDRVRIRINLESREFEVEGDAGYINERFGADIDEFLHTLQKPKKSSSAQPEPNSLSATHRVSQNDNTNGAASKNSGVPDSFGEFFNRFPKSISIVDKLLLASYYVQCNNQDKVFTLKEAADLLLDQGVKLSNPNAFNKANGESKRIFKTTGKNFRVSESGLEYINSLNGSLTS